MSKCRVRIQTQSVWLQIACFELGANSGSRPGHRQEGLDQVASCDVCTSQPTCWVCEHMHNATCVFHLSLAKRRSLTFSDSHKVYNQRRTKKKGYEWKHRAVQRNEHEPGGGQGEA